MVQFPYEHSHRTTTTTRHWQQQLNHHLYLEEVSNTNFQHYRGNQTLEMESTLAAMTMCIRNIFLTSFRMDTCARVKTIQIIGICNANRTTEGRLNRKPPQLTHALHRYPYSTHVGSMHRHVYTPWDAYGSYTFSKHWWPLNAP